MEYNTHNDRKKTHGLCCDQNEVANILVCLCELKKTINCILECTGDHSSGIKERIALCVLFEEIRRIEAKLDNPLFGLNEIKHEIIDINNIITNSTFGLKEVKNEVWDIESLLTNQVFGLNEIKNEIITINDLLNNATFGIPELKREIRTIENNTNTTNNFLSNKIFGLNEIKNEIRGIENQTILLTNEVFGLNEIKNEIRELNRPLTCTTDSVTVCGQSVGSGTSLTIHTDTNGNISTIPSASTYSQMGRLYAATLFTYHTSALSHAYLSITNPGPRVLFLERIYGGTKESSLLILQRDIDFTGGTEQTARNLNFAFSDESIMKVKSISDTDENVIGVFIGAIRSTSFDINYRGEVIVPPGHNLLIEVIPGSAGGWLTVSWFEL